MCGHHFNTTFINIWPEVVCFPDMAQIVKYGVMLSGPQKGLPCPRARQAASGSLGATNYRILGRQHSGSLKATDYRILGRQHSGWQRVAEGNVMKGHTLRIQMNIFFNCSGDYIKFFT